MTYASISFILFVALSVLAYFALPLKKSKWIFLLISSYTFYLFAGYKYIAFILFTTVSTYVIARCIDHVSCKSKVVLDAYKKEWDKNTKKKYKNKTKRNKRLLLALCLVINFGILSFLKYYNFFAASINGVFGTFKIDFSVPILNLFLPLGISFYTFQSMGYLVDVYREKFPAERNVAKFALFVSFFPQIIQGPISFYDQLAQQLYTPHSFNFTRFKYGCELILWGFFKKLVIADRAVIAINYVVSDYNSYNGSTLVFIVLLYALQLYADFSGGIDISRGIAQIFGIEMAVNFRRPYFSKSISEYWRRWHISLGSWMKEYIFYPLSLSKAFLTASKKMKGTRFGNTKVGLHIAKVLPTAVASLIVFLIVGIWHGASWKYVAFGLWNGGIIMLSILFKPLTDCVVQKLKIKPGHYLWRFFQILRTFVIICIGYVFDVAPSFRQAIWTFKTITFGQSFNHLLGNFFITKIEFPDLCILIISSIVLFIVSVVQEKNNQYLRTILNKKHWLFECALIVLLLVSILTFGIYGSEFDTADFVYAQF